MSLFIENSDMNSIKKKIYRKSVFLSSYIFILKASKYFPSQNVFTFISSRLKQSVGQCAILFVHISRVAVRDEIRQFLGSMRLYIRRDAWIVSEITSVSRIPLAFRASTKSLYSAAFHIAARGIYDGSSGFEM